MALYSFQIYIEFSHNGHGMLIFIDDKRVEEDNNKQKNHYCSVLVNSISS